MKTRAETPNLNKLQTFVTVVIGLLCGVIIGLLVTEEFFDVMMAHWKYALCLLAAVLLPFIIAGIMTVLPLYLARHLAAVWWMGRGSYKGLDDRWHTCRHPRARAFAAVPLPPSLVREPTVDIALHILRARLKRGALWAMLSLALPVAFLLYVSGSAGYALTWPVYAVAAVYLLSTLLLLLSGYTERNGAPGPLRQARLLKKNRLWALTDLWSALRLHYPHLNVDWLYVLCLKQLAKANLDDRLTWLAADQLLVDRIAYHRDQPVPAPLMRVVRDVVKRSDVIYRKEGDRALPLMVHLLSGYAVGLNTRPTANKLFDEIVLLEASSDIGRYVTMQAEHLLKEADRSEQLADRKLIAPYVGYAYYTCFEQFYALQSEVNKPDTRVLKRKKRIAGDELQPVVAPSAEPEVVEQTFYQAAEVVEQAPAETVAVVEDSPVVAAATALPIEVAPAVVPPEAPPVVMPPTVTLTPLSGAQTPAPTQATADELPLVSAVPQAQPVVATPGSTVPITQPVQQPTKQSQPTQPAKPAQQPTPPDPVLDPWAEPVAAPQRPKSSFTAFATAKQRGVLRPHRPPTAEGQHAPKTSQTP